jgi:hypothetical protein
MKKQFGEIMNKENEKIQENKELRKTEILEDADLELAEDEEIIDELQDEIFDKLNHVRQG